MGNSLGKRLTRGLPLAAIATLALSVGVTQAVAKKTIVTCGQVITANTHVGLERALTRGPSLAYGFFTGN